MKKALITGGAGFVGGLIADVFDSDIYDIQFGDDIFDTEKLIKRMKGKDLVVHLAAVPSPFRAVSEEDYWHLNRDGTKQVVKCIKRAGVKKIIFCSSDAVYGFSNHCIKVKYLPIDEEHPLPPEEDLEVYDRTKIACEKFLLEARGITAVIFRLAHPAWDERGFLPESHLFAGVTRKNLKKFMRLAVKYKGKSDVFNIGDEKIATQFCPNSIAFAKANYPNAEIRLKSPTKPLYSIKKAIKILGFK